MKYFILLIFMLIFVKYSWTQDFEIAQIEFFDISGEMYANPFVGGLRTPQFNQMDLNGDGLLDLIVFDRAGNVILPFLADKNESQVSYIYSPQYESMFPKIIEWMSLFDYDQDGVEDIFCFPTVSSLPGIEVHKGSLIDDEITFELVELPNFSFDVLSFPTQNNYTQIYVSQVDLPCITDLDNDGDVDVLAFGTSGSTVFFYQNMGMEEEGLPSLDRFVLKDPCYGKFLESGFSQQVFLSDDSLICATVNGRDFVVNTRHAGSTVEVFDSDGDGNMDLLLGDLAFSGVNFMQNISSSVDAWMGSTTFNYPEGDSIAIESFVSVKNIDFNLDGKKDLIFSNNYPIGSQTYDHIWAFENLSDKGTNPALISKNFLVNNIIDLGEHASPCFFDYNSDGLLDLLIGTSGQFITSSEKNPKMHLFENTGTTTSPKFRLVDDDYLGFSEFRNTSSFFAPNFGDLDGDGDLDLVVGDDIGKLYYVENLSQDKSVIELGTPSYDHFEIEVSGYARPFIEDLNEDGLGDLVIGERNFNSTDEFAVASLNYFENIGIIGAPNFNPDVNQEPNNAAFGGVNLKKPGFIRNNSAPCIYKSNEFQMIVGSEPGNLTQYSTIRSNLGGVFEQNEMSKLNVIDVGFDSHPAAADIDSDGYLEVVVGNYRGGINFYETKIEGDIGFNRDLGSSVNVLPFESLHIYPNPVSDFLNFQSTSEFESNSYFEIFDSKYRLIKQGFSEDNHIEVQDLIAGVYFIRLKSSNSKYQYLSKFIKLP